MSRAIVLASLLFVGCAGGTADLSYSGTAYAEPEPSLVEVTPGVQVIADYDYPVFYSDGAYYRYDAGVWYRSPHYRSGWSRTYDVPARVRTIDNPGAYAHYRANVTYRREPQVRDHREYRPEPAPTPVVRDHRDDAPPVIHHDDQRDEREHRAPMPERREQPARPERRDEPARPEHREEPARPERREQPAQPERREQRREEPARPERNDNRDKKHERDKDHRD